MNEKAQRESFHLSEKEKKNCSMKIEGKDNNREGMKNQGEDNNIYCWSVQSVRHSFQSNGHDFQGRLLDTIFKFFFLFLEHGF